MLTKIIKILSIIVLAYIVGMMAVSCLTLAML